MVLMLFEVWAPEADLVTLRLGRAEHPMERVPEGRDGPRTGRTGWWSAEAPASPGDRYGFRLDEGPVRPDPRSRRQPEGPDGLSAVVDHDAFRWRHPWPGRPLQGAVLYELHIGTFTPQGTFDAAAERLPHLASLGVTHVELMPVSPFPGRHGWGYEGVSLWAVHEPYGGPDGLKRFVDAAHGQGLGVVLDVVHNHLGPAGNHLPFYGPYFTERHQTPWGAAVNLDAPGSDEVRAYLTGQATAFLRDYRLDGLRLDAVHALADTRADHFLSELSRSVEELATECGRPLFLVAESDRNDPRTTTPRDEGGLGVDAQWNDDFHHALHTTLTGESQGYYADFAHAGPAALEKTLKGAFFHDGTYSTFRGRHHGRPLPATAPAHRFLAYAQTHDQIGNRAQGDRLSARLTPGLLACAAALVLLSPGTPMLFMGEEWGAGTPWQFFTGHTDPGLADAVRRGRRREFAAHGWSGSEIPDPQDPATRDRSCLDWSEPDRTPHAELLAWHRRLIRLRHDRPEPARVTLGDTRVRHDPGARWLTLHNGPLHTAVNLHPDRTAQLTYGDEELSLLAAWDEQATHLHGNRLELPPQSAAVLGPTG